MESFLASLDRMLDENYVPSIDDCLHVRLRTTGITEHVVDIDPFTYRLFDTGGARSERKKWIHIFEGVDILLFFVPLDGYDNGMIYDTVSISNLLIPY